MHKKKVISSIAIVLLVCVSVFKLVDAYSEKQASKALGNAVVTYAAVRALGGAISMIQESTMEIAPGGVGVTLALGQVLDPLNDLLENFSDIMLLSVTSLGIQRLLLSIGTSTLFTALPLLAGSCLLLMLWTRPGGNSWFQFTVRSFVVIIIIRFAVPVVVIANDLMYTAVLEDEYSSSQQEINMVAARLDATAMRMQTDLDGSDSPGDSGVINQAVNPPAKQSQRESGWLDQASDWWQSHVSSKNPLDQLDAVKENANKAINHIFDMIVVFVLQTVLFPLACVLLFYRLVKPLMFFDYSRWFYGRPDI
jgi:hypothetical protein